MYLRTGSYKKSDIDKIKELVDLNSGKTITEDLKFNTEKKPFADFIRTKDTLTQT